MATIAERSHANILPYSPLTPDSVSVTMPHRAMRKPPESPDAWAAYQRGLWHLEKATINDDALAEMRWPIGSFARPLISRNDQARADFNDARKPELRRRLLRAFGNATSGSCRIRDPWHTGWGGVQGAGTHTMIGNYYFGREARRIFNLPTYPCNERQYFDEQKTDWQTLHPEVLALIRA